MSAPDAARPGNTYSVLTSAGPAAIAAIQVRGGGVPEFVARHVRLASGDALRELASGRVVRAQLWEAADGVLDDIIVAVHVGAPDWELRLFLHGSPWLVRRCCELLGAAGFARQEEPGVSLWPARDAIEAEACALLPQMQTLAGARWLLEQADRLRLAVYGLLQAEHWELERTRCLELSRRVEAFDWFSRPVRVVLAGPANAGKSTLMNALAEQEVSLTSPHAGTTRDWVEAAAAVRGFPVVWVDTAGLRQGQAGLDGVASARTRDCIRSADAVVLVLDGAAPDSELMMGAGVEVEPTVIVINKSDRAEFHRDAVDSLPSGWRERAVVVSAAERANIAQIEDVLLRELGRSVESAVISGAFTVRQAECLKRASVATDERYYRTFVGAVVTAAA